MFLEHGYVNDKFIALQIMKAPVYKEEQGKKILLGTIGTARNLTYDYKDHQDISLLLDKINTEDSHINEIKDLFDTHKNRYRFSEKEGIVSQQSLERPEICDEIR